MEEAMATPRAPSRYAYIIPPPLIMNIRPCSRYQPRYINANAITHSHRTRTYAHVQVHAHVHARFASVCRLKSRSNQKRNAFIPKMELIGIGVGLQGAMIPVIPSWRQIRWYWNEMYANEWDRDRLQNQDENQSQSQAQSQQQQDIIQYTNSGRTAFDTIGKILSIPRIKLSFIIFFMLLFLYTILTITVSHPRVLKPLVQTIPWLWKILDTILKYALLGAAYMVMLPLWIKPAIMAGRRNLKIRRYAYMGVFCGVVSSVKRDETRSFKDRVRVRLSDVAGSSVDITTPGGQDVLELNLAGMQAKVVVMSNSEQFLDIERVSDMYIPKLDTFLGPYPYLNQYQMRKCSADLDTFLANYNNESR